MGKDLVGIERYMKFAAAVLRQLPRDITPDAAKHWIQKRGELKKKLRELLITGEATANVIIPSLGDWPRFYQDVLGIMPDFSGLAILKDLGGYGWPLPMAKGLTANRLYAECKRRFTCYSYVGDLDKVVSTNERTADKVSYIIRVRDRVEADEELKNLSADKIKQLKLTTITLTERLLLELWYFWRTGQHLDIDYVTLCTGSRSFDGNVPDVSWGDSRFYVGWSRPVLACGNLRARSAVS